MAENQEDTIQVHFNPLAGLDTVNLNGDVFSPEAIAEMRQWVGADGFTSLNLPTKAMDKVLYDLFVSLDVKLIDTLTEEEPQ